MIYYDFFKVWLLLSPTLDCHNNTAHYTLNTILRTLADILGCFPLD